MGQVVSEYRSCSLALLASVLLAVTAYFVPAASAAPFSVKTDLFDPENETSLGLPFAPSRKTYTVFAPSSEENTYNHGAVVIQFGDRLYVQWQSSKKDEDAPDTRVMYAWADVDDPEHWSAPRQLHGAGEQGIITNGGWWSDGKSLIAFLNVWSRNADDQRIGRTKYMVSQDGLTWSSPEFVTGLDGQPVPGVIEQDPLLLDSGMIVTAFHIEPGIMATPFTTEDPLAVTGWRQGKFQNLGHKNGVSRELEPSAFSKKNGNLVMIFRDQFSSYKTLASESSDNGRSWTKATLIDFPDSRSKQSAGNLPDGTVFRVNNPRSDKRRFPLVVSLSNSGEVFDRAYLIRGGGEDMQPQRFEGKYKRSGYSYPKSAVIGQYLYVAYATNKEDVEITRIPWKQLTVN